VLPCGQISSGVSIHKHMDCPCAVVVEWAGEGKGVVVQEG
jgi:hypothetical protein